MKVRVHLNLHRGDWAITGTAGAMRGKVIEYRDSVILRDVTFYVSEPQRQKSIALKKRKVHGWAQGELVDAETLPVPSTPITYRPFDCGTFVTREGEPVARCDYVEFRPEQFTNARGQPYRKAYARGRVNAE